MSKSNLVKDGVRLSVDQLADRAYRKIIFLVSKYCGSRLSEANMEHVDAYLASNSNLETMCGVLKLHMKTDSYIEDILEAIALYETARKRVRNINLIKLI